MAAKEPKPEERDLAAEIGGCSDTVFSKIQKALGVSDRDGAITLVKEDKAAAKVAAAVLDSTIPADDAESPATSKAKKAQGSGKVNF